MAGAESPTFLAFDLGASHGRAILGRLDEGQIHREEVHQFPTPVRQQSEPPAWDLDVLWHELRTGLDRALDVSSSLQSLSVDSWAVDYVPLGPEGTPLRNPHCYRDVQTETAMEEAFETVPPASIYEKTGIQFLPFNTLYQVLADREREPELFRRTESRLTVADYFNFCFGGRPVIERSMASTTQLMDVRQGTWAEPLLAAFDLSRDRWPPIVPSGTTLGTARETTDATVVAGCSHDTACAVAATPMEENGGSSAYLSCGTWSLLGAELDRPIVTEEARSAGFTNEAGVDGSIRFLTNLTGLWPLQECVRTWREEDTVSYTELLEEAERAASPPFTLDLEEERFRERGGMEETIRTACREEGLPVPETKGAVTRLILESLAESHRRALRQLEDLTGQAVDTLHLVGGGSKNELLCQWTADRCGCRVVAGPGEATALGNLLTQARTVGALSDRSIRDVARRSVSLSTYTSTSVTN